MMIYILNKRLFSGFKTNINNCSFFLFNRFAPPKAKTVLP